MQIRNKLALYFTIVSSILSLLVFAAINLLVDRHTKSDFFNALKERAIVTAQVYLEADEISDSSLKHFKEEYLNTLPQEVVRMYDLNGRPSFIKDDDRHWPISIINTVKKEKYLQYIQNNRAVVGIEYDDNQGSFIILVSAFDKEGLQRKKDLWKISTALFFIQLIVLFLLGRWFAKKTLEPVKKINDQVQNINARDLHLRVDEGNGKDEISELAINFNSLLNRLEDSFQMQRTFVANASHELRTPLTSIIGEVEVILAHDREKEEYKSALDSVLAEAEKLESIIEGLLSLGNTENMIALQSVEAVRLDDLLWEVQSNFQKSNPGCVFNIQIVSLPNDEGKLYVTANKHLLLLAISNVVKNAFKFSHNRPVNCNLQYNEGEGITITITDKGIGISNEDLENIYNPFYRGKQAKAFSGQGLGLFITKKILDIYKGKITIKSIEGAGTSVTINF
jgi:signal transduction histidine kinase